MLGACVGVCMGVCGRAGVVVGVGVQRAGRQGLHALLSGVHAQGSEGAGLGLQFFCLQGRVQGSGVPVICWCAAPFLTLLTC